ncbi:putative membrane protein [Clavibacter sp. B3I6]|uniref:hypothetical protein n=1 Tax=Clavibacter sp. B3I6 TaxID=3042268 RepID=UPI00277F8EB6|nr:hypothetical protein [Clavibacter sp. B3I6]MDQ0743009.1 putative membrane protein [Clavibacter sp. B3I6]
MVMMRRTLWLVLGAVLALVGAAVTVLYFFQPWRTCPYEDTAAGCAMLDGDATVMMIAMAVMLLGVSLFLAGVLQRWRSRIQ